VKRFHHNNINFWCFCFCLFYSWRMSTGPI